jgi:hypothetical protein
MDSSIASILKSHTLLIPTYQWAEGIHFYAEKVTPLIQRVQIPKPYLKKQTESASYKKVELCFTSAIE